jgi:uncharacterized integral membrane protein
MSVLRRHANKPVAPETASTERTPEPPSAITRPQMHRTSTSVAWLGLFTVAVIFAALIVFMLQNTGSVEVSFLWMHGSLPLAMTVLIAGVSAALLTTMVGVARVTQLRRRFRLDH